MKQDELPQLAHPTFYFAIGRELRPSAVHLYEAAMMKPLDLPKLVKQPKPGMFSQNMLHHNRSFITLLETDLLEKSSSLEKLLREKFLSKKFADKFFEQKS